MWGGAPSAQDLLGLSEQVKLCSEDIDRKAMQVHVRAKEIREITLRQLREDVDAIVSTTKDPLHVSAQHGKCMRGSRAHYRRGHPGKHKCKAWPGHTLRRCYQNCRVLSSMCSIAEHQDGFSSTWKHRLCGPNFIGLYGTCCPAWKRYYGTLKTTISFPIDKLSAAMQFFDSIRKKALFGVAIA